MANKKLRLVALLAVMLLLACTLVACTVPSFTTTPTTNVSYKVNIHSEGQSDVAWDRKSDFPTLERAHYTFEGLYLDADFTKPTTVSDLKTMWLTEDITVYVNWTKILYKITVHPANGEIDVTWQLGDKIPSFSKVGYVVDGFYFDEKFTQAVDLASLAELWENKDVWVKWKECDHKAVAEWTIDKDATCTEAGHKHTTCPTCAQYLEEDITALGHKLTKHDRVDATCTVAGNVEYWSCEVCKKNYSDAKGTNEITDVVIPAHGHNQKGHIDHVDPTCTEPGVVGGTYCTSCTLGKSEAEAVIPATGHSYGEVKYEWLDGGQTCIATRVCTNGTSHEQIAYATVTPNKTQDATCDKPELTTYTAIFAVDWATTQVKENVVTENALGHNEEGHIEHKDATCTADGVVGGTYCTRCEHGRAEAEAVITKLGHNSDGHVAHVDATCTEPGVVGGNYCTRCYDGKAAAEAVIPAKGHSYGTLIAKNPASCEDTGVAAHYKCSCGQLFNASFNEVEYKDLILPATNHKWGEVSYTWTQDADGNWKCTARRVCENDSVHAEEKHAALDNGFLSVTKQDLSCTQDEVYTYTTKYNSIGKTWAEEQTKVVVKQKATGHSMTVLKSDNDYHWYECANNCGLTSEKVKHTWKENRIITPATEEAEGLRELKCEHCGKTKEEAIPELGHTHKFDESKWEYDETHHWHPTTCPCTVENKDCDGYAEHTFGATVYTWSQDSQGYWTCSATRSCGCGHVQSTNAKTIRTSLTTTPTCTDKGEITYTAKFDVDWAKEDIKIVDVAINPNAHKFGNWQDEKPATCTESGTKGYKDCEYCHKHFDNEGNEITDLTIDAKGHTMEEVVAILATCTNEGTLRHYHCSVCEKNFEDQQGTKELASIVEPINENNHNYTSVVTAPTCTAQGYTTHTCSDCGDSYKDLYVDALEHDYGAWVSNGNGTHTKTCLHDASHTVTENCHGGTATCTKHAICADCGKEYGSLAEHVYDQKNTDINYLASEATCQAKAKYYYSCSCGKKGTETFEYGEKDSTKHTGILEWIQTETTHKHAYNCCGAVEVEEENHHWENGVCTECKYECQHSTSTDWIIDKAATCTVAGSKHKECTICGETTATGTIAIDPTNHKFGEWKTEVGETCTETGIKGHKDCEYCHEHFDANGNEIDDLKIEALGHDEVHHGAQAPTCTEAGWEAYVTCSRCEYTTYQEIPAGHTYGDLIAAVEAGDSTPAIAAHYHCSACGKYFDADKNEVEYSNLIIAEQGKQYTSSIVIKDVADANGWENEKVNGSFSFDILTLSATCTKPSSNGQNTGKYYKNGNNWRIYQNETPSLIIGAKEGYAIVSVKVTYTGGKNGVMTFGTEQIKSDTTVEVNAESVTFSVGNTSTATNGNIQITTIEVVWKVYSDEDKAQTKANEIANGLTLDEIKFAEVGNTYDKLPTSEDASITWSLADNNYVSLNGNVLEVIAKPTGDDAKISLTATVSVTVNGVTKTAERTFDDIITVYADAVKHKVSVTDNKFVTVTIKDQDGNDIGTEVEEGTTLTITVTKKGVSDKIYGTYNILIKNGETVLTAENDVYKVKVNADVSISVETEAVLDTQEQIVGAAYDLEVNETIENQTLKGKVKEINYAYTDDKGISFTMEIDGVSDEYKAKTIYVYMLKYTGAKYIAVDDIISVTGTLTNYNGKIEFGSGSEFKYDGYCKVDVTVSVAEDIKAVVTYLGEEISGTKEFNGKTKCSEFVIAITLDDGYKAIVTVNGTPSEVTASGDFKVTVTGNTTIEIKTEEKSSTGTETPSTETLVATFDLTSAAGYTNGTEVSTVTASGYTATFSKGTGSNAPKYYTKGDAVRLYAKGTLTVSGSNIVKIVLTFTDTSTNEISTNSGSISNGIWTIENGSTSSVVFTIGGTSGNKQISKIEVYAVA